MRMGHRKWRGRLVTGYLLLLGACTGDTAPEDTAPGDTAPAVEKAAPGELLRSDAAWVEKPEVSDADVARVAAGNSEFGAALYRELREPGKNLFFSPYSLTQSLVMTYAGARGETERQLGLGLHVTLPPERFHPAMNALNQRLLAPSRHKGPGQIPRLSRVNATWVQKDFAFEAGYLALLARHYDTGVRVVDFLNDSPAVREDINAWVAWRTENRIQDLLPPSAVTQRTRLMLVNALHFLGAWATPFAEKGTRNEPFHLLDGSTRPVPMMSGGSASGYVKGQGFEALALDYVGREFRLLLVVPDAGQFEAVEGRLSAGFLDSVRGAFQPGNGVDVYLPRFELNTEAALIPKLERLGITDLFGARSDLSGLSRTEPLRVLSVQHKAFVSVNERGTEAAAATAVEGGGTSVPPSVRVDRPFLFVIEHVGTRTVLFLGRYVAP